MAAEAGYAVGVHCALHEIVALHAILMSCSIGEMSEGSFTQLVIFQLPVILEVFAHIETHGPIVISALDRVLQRAPLRVALYAGVIGADRIQASGVDDIGPRRCGCMRAARAMTLLTAYVPLGHGVGL